MINYVRLFYKVTGQEGKKDRKVIVAIKRFLENLFDGHTIESLFNQMKDKEF